MYKFYKVIGFKVQINMGKLMLQKVICDIYKTFKEHQTDLQLSTIALKLHDHNVQCHTVFIPL